MRSTLRFTLFPPRGRVWPNAILNGQAHQSSRSRRDWPAQIMARCVECLPAQQRWPGVPLLAQDHHLLDVSLVLALDELDSETISEMAHNATHNAADR